MVRWTSIQKILRWTSIQKIFLQLQFPFFGRYQLHNSSKISQQNKAKTPKHHPIKEVFAELNPPVTSPQQKPLLK